MALNRSPAYIAVALLLLLAAAAPLALAQAPPPQITGPPELGVPLQLILAAIRIIGVLCCSLDGSCTGGNGIAGVNYTVSCGNALSSFVAPKGSTSVNGSFTVNLTNITALLRGVDLLNVLDGNLPCEMYINLPIDQALCPALGSVNGVLAGLVRPALTMLMPNTPMPGFTTPMPGANSL